MNKLVVEKKLSITSDRPLPLAGERPMSPEDSSTMRGSWTTLRSRGSCVPWELPHGGEGQFLEPRALMPAGRLSAAACAACAFEETRPGAGRSVCCQKGRPGNRGRPCRHPAGRCQPSASYREAGGPALAAAQCLVSVRDRRQLPGSSSASLDGGTASGAPGTSAGHAVAPGAPAGQPPQGCSQRRGPGRGPQNRATVTRFLCFSDHGFARL